MPCLSNQGYVSIILFKKQGPALAYHPFFFANRSGFCLRAIHGVKIRQRSRKIRVKSVWFVGYPLQSEKRYGILLGNRSHGSRKFMKKKAELIPLLWTLTVPVSVCLRPSSSWWLFPPISPPQRQPSPRSTASGSKPGPDDGNLRAARDAEAGRRTMTSCCPPPHRQQRGETSPPPPWPPCCVPGGSTSMAPPYPPWP